MNFWAMHHRATIRIIFLITDKGLRVKSSP